MIKNMSLVEKNGAIIISATNFAQKNTNLFSLKNPKIEILSKLYNVKY